MAIWLISPKQAKQPEPGRQAEVAPEAIPTA
jgi:hypothetical protein